MVGPLILVPPDFDSASVGGWRLASPPLSSDASYSISTDAPATRQQRPAVPSRLFTHREFAFTLQGEIYLRYNSFQTAEDMKKEVLRLNPTRFEIGPIYSARVRPVAVSLIAATSSSRVVAEIAADPFIETDASHSPRTSTRRHASAFASFSASRQEDGPPDGLLAAKARARLRHRHDGLRRDPNVLSGQGYVQAVLGVYRRCRGCS